MTITWKDIDLSFERKRDGDIGELNHVDAVMKSLSNIMTTIMGSRRMLSDFANNYYYLLFEPMDEITAGQLGEVFLNAIEKWEDRVIIQNVNVNPNYTMNLYEVIVTFTLRNSDQIYQIQEILRRG